MTDYRGQIAEAVVATHFRSPTSFTWFGQEPLEIPSRLLATLSDTEARNLLLFILQSRLYNDFYCLGFPAPTTYSLPVPEVETTFFVKELDAANRGKGYSESGMWRIRQVRQDEIIAKRDGLELVVEREQFVHRQVSRELRTTLRAPQQLSGISPGFYLVVGNREWPRRDAIGLNRFYWNLTATGAATFIRAVTSALNSASLPFRVKVANHPSRFNRCDSGVLYLPVADYDSIARALGKIFRAVASYLKQGTPALTKLVAPGLGWAENPTKVYSDSFGLHRCSLLADGMLRAWERGKNLLQSRLQMVEARFNESGISLEEPFLNPRSRARNEFDHLAAQLLQVSRTPSIAGIYSADSRSFLATAHGIAEQLSQQALWHEGQCSWFGAETPSPGPESGANQPTYKVLGPDLYSGTSGVALFLAEFYEASSGDAEARRASIGAIRHSLSCTDAIPPGSRLSLYEGWTGIALASICVSAALGSEELLDRASALLKRLSHGSPAIESNSIVSGKAGAIVGLLFLWSALHDQTLLECATRLGDALLKDAIRSTRGISWASAGIHGRANSIGFSDGIAGIAYALLGLFRATGNAAYRKPAEEALVFETNCLNAKPRARASDLKSSPRRATVASSTETSWSHGSPGIALSRIRAFEILNDATYKAGAVPAIRTTRQTLENWRRVAHSDFSLAHGIAGNAELLLYASDVFGGELRAESWLAVQVAREAARNCAVIGYDSKWGPRAAETPGLMSGLAGIGHFYLRLRDRRIPSALTWSQQTQKL